MAVEESRHAYILKETRGVLPQSCLSRPVNAAEAALIVSVEAELARAATLELHTLDDAYKLAHRLESSEVNTVFQLLVSYDTDDIATDALFNAQFDEHLDRLKRLAGRFDRPMRRNIALQT
ncbi:MAG: hypothetical protein PF636_06110 [Actinomycetota bacterium]|jgi:hypothetical protein|nr:hypothetical protein [Actinomycetota bacterium]